LAKIKFDEIIISDQTRTISTAQQILNVNLYKNSKITYSEQVRERSFGILEGKLSSIYRMIMESKNINERKFKPMKGESKFDLFRRARKFLFELLCENIKIDFVVKLGVALDMRSQMILKNFRNKFDAELTEDQENEYKALEADLNCDKRFLLEDTVDEEKIMEGIFISEEVKEEYCIEEFDKEAIDKHLEILDLEYLNSKPYAGYDENENIKRVLLVSHSSIMKEMLNVFRKLQGRKLGTQYAISNTGIYVIRIYCRFCGMKKCENNPKCEFNRLEFDYVLMNDTSHLEILKSDL
jgi:broad specificity phosphatase PhoE